MKLHRNTKTLVTPSLDPVMQKLPKTPHARKSHDRIYKKKPQEKKKKKEYKGKIELTSGRQWHLLSDTDTTD